MRGLLSVTLSQQLRRQAAELMGKYGISVPKGVAITSLDGVQKAIKDTFAGQDEGAEFMGKYGINVPNGVAITSLDEVQKAIKDTFAGQDLVYLCKKLSLVNDMYVPLTLDRKTGSPSVPIHGFTGITDEDALKAAAMEQMKSDQVADIAEKMVTKQTGPKGKGIGPQVKQTGPRKPPLVSRWLDEGTEDIAIIAPDAFSVEGIEVGVLRAPEWIRAPPTIELVRPLLPNTRVVVHSDASLERTPKGFLCCMAHVGRDMDTGELIWYATGVCDAFSEYSNPAELSGMLYACYMAKCLGIEHLLIKCDNTHADYLKCLLSMKTVSCRLLFLIVASLVITVSLISGEYWSPKFVQAA